ncbi:MAG: YggS family pyridoxal phosphate-dependent enzyme [Gomphosphaeria aponina SAG 52.96 = DSM 107014]|uniref:Pyridoxal phosphate homeostasis protein n=1 Tax=Gomphosphaeria aponina SAG 52.96 = DSM 107014 TaxID=1521640 RepID=A0A941GPN1_9CHRO|nr:YggS family pyridoxal phosphate-dependent enzyme [Gomphosphaeria aponina SAG 52.96 = DSM 107014]
MNGFISQNINQIRQQLPSHVRLIAITKQVSVIGMREAYGAGIRDFGENRLQEALLKQEQLQDLPDICWHFIGHLQTNKGRKVLEKFQWIHSVDSLKLASRLNELAGEIGKTPQVCLQVKVLADPNKYGWEIPELLADLPQLDHFSGLKIQGLMTILPLGLSEAETFGAFRELSLLSEKISQANWLHLQMQELSMGMSADYKFAVSAGATMIRLGRIIFGARMS